MSGTSVQALERYKSPEAAAHRLYLSWNECLLRCLAMAWQLCKFLDGTNLAQSGLQDKLHAPAQRCTCSCLGLCS